MITKILHKPVSIAQHVVGGVARGGLHGAVTVVKKFLPDDHQAPPAKAAPTPTKDTAPEVSTEPVTQPPSPTTTTKKARTNTMPAKKASAKRAAAKKTAPKKTGPKKPAAVLDEEPAPIDDDPVVYSTGPDVSTTVSADDLRL
ncbi:hypothetical protein [Aeromicrobium sp. NPDC092404]|uniref:hypothetical protein n=1 Tax=Aeromicrobium sp. NPDC092404 TaxID=3154976 RepID=UPI0034257B39